MTMIPAGEVLIDPSSYVDPQGRVFLWQGRVFRGVSGNGASHIRRLLNNTVVKRLQDRGVLIDSRIPSETTDGFDLLIEHQRIQYPSYCFEWTPEMLKEAALLTLNICLEISDEGLTLQDAYPWNIFFESTKPVFIDFGSLSPARDDVLWAAYEQFCNFFLFPLYLYSVGQYTPARLFLYDYLNGLPNKAFFQLAPLSLKARHPLRYIKHASSYHLANVIQRFGLEEKIREVTNRSYKKFDVTRGRKKFLAALLQEVESIKLSSQDSHWRRYYEKDVCSYREDDFAKKRNIIYNVLERCKPATVLDMGCNTGVYSLLATKYGARVVAFDTDQPSVSALYQEAKRTSADILPLVVDVLNPTPSFGWCARQFPRASERLQTDMVFAFALIHHLAITCRQSFSRILETLDQFAKSYILLEWVGPEDHMARRLMRQSASTYSWYKFECLENELRKRYVSYDIFPPHMSGRQFILCRKINSH